MYPYSLEFETWCKNANKLSNNTISMISISLKKFWDYSVSNAIEDTKISSIGSNDVRDYLISLDVNENLQPTTINKYLSYLKKYFRFLASHSFIKSYPLYDLKGISIDRRQKYVVNWMPYINDFIDKDMHPETIKLLLAISLGYDPSDLLHIRWSNISNKINNNELKNYIVNHLNLAKTPNPYLFETAKCQPYTTIEAVMHKVRKDQKKIPFSLAPIKLRQSYIFSLVSDTTKTDDELLKKLNCSKNTLNYYHTCVNYYHLTEYNI